MTNAVPPSVMCGIAQPGLAACVIVADMAGHAGPETPRDAAMTVQPSPSFRRTLALGAGGLAFAAVAGAIVVLAYAVLPADEAVEHPPPVLAVAPLGE